MYNFYYTFACFIRLLIKSCKGQKSNVDIMTDFFNEYFKKPTKKDFEKNVAVLNKCVVSKIMNYHRSLPKAIVNILLDDNYEEKIKSAIDKFIEKYIGIRLIDNLINQLEDKISKAENINADEKEHIENLKIKIEKDEINFINEVFKIILDKKIEISHLTILSNEKISKNIFIIDFKNENENENEIVY